MAQEDEQPLIDLRDAVGPAFLSGKGVLTISTRMPDAAIILAIRQALAYGKPFMVIPGIEPDAQTLGENH